MIKKAFFIAALVFSGASNVFAQDDLLNLIEDKKPEGHEKVYATFKTTRIINAQSIETVKRKTMDFRITHKFGNIGEASGGGPHNLYGWDAISDVRLAFEIGITDKLMIGVGRSKRNENIDGMFKWRFLEQTKDNHMPITVALYHSTAFTPMDKSGLYSGTTITANEENIAHRFSYTTQLLIARKFGDVGSLQLIPGYTHRNFVKRYVNTNQGGAEDENDLFSLGVGGRIRLTKHMAIIGDFFYVFSKFRDNNPDMPYYFPFSIGWEIETGGHVFNLSLTNAPGILENDFIPNGPDNWLRGGFKFGFNISRVFNI